jgi:hypothetical protein
MSFLLDTVFRKNESRLIFPISFEIIEHLKKNLSLILSQRR